MTRERLIRITALGGIAGILGILLVGRGGARPSVEAPPQDVLFLRNQRAVTLVRSLPEGEAVRLPGAVPSADFSAVVHATPRGDETEVTALEPASGAQLWSRMAPGVLEVKVVSPDARLVALGSPAAEYPRGRSSTTLVVVGADGAPARTIELDGNYEPEAFSTDGHNLFVVQYLPPLAPTSYRVRRLDLQTGEVTGVYSADAHLQKAMQGTARIQAASPDGRRLYTLYTLQAGGTTRAFVHVLSLDELWAHCIDLPADVQVADESSFAISVAPDGGRLYVADASSDRVLEVDTESLQVRRTVPTDLGEHRGVAQAANATDGTLYVGRGTRLLALDGAELTPSRSWDLDGRITGIQPAADGRRVYVGMRDEIVILDPGRDGTLGVLDPGDLGSIDQLGRSTRALTEARTVVECAC